MKPSFPIVQQFGSFAQSLDVKEMRETDQETQLCTVASTYAKSSQDGCTICWPALLLPFRNVIFQIAQWLLKINKTL